MIVLASDGQINWIIVEHTDRYNLRFKWELRVGPEQSLSAVGWTQTESEARAEVAKVVMQRVIEW